VYEEGRGIFRSAEEQMSNSEWIEPRVDRTVFSVIDGFDDDSAECEYWLSRTPAERLRHAELLRPEPVKVNETVGGGN
jgi:hypothetical protein